MKDATKNRNGMDLIEAEDKVARIHRTAGGKKKKSS